MALSPQSVLLRTLTLNILMQLPENRNEASMRTNEWDFIYSEFILYSYNMTK